jgi:hypothetical protein
MRESRHGLMSATTIASYGQNGQKDVCFSKTLKKSASGVLASFRSSTYRSKPTGGKVTIRSHGSKRAVQAKLGMYLLGPSLAAALPAEPRVSARRGRAGEKSGLFEHLAGVFCTWPRRAGHRSSALSKWFFRSQLGLGSRSGFRPRTIDGEGRILERGWYCLFPTVGPHLSLV